MKRENAARGNFPLLEDRLRPESSGFTSGAEHGSEMATPGMKIMVVDDEAAMREVLEMRLTEWGHKVRTAASGEEAEKLVGRFRPSAVVSDVVLPDQSGLELLGTLKSGDADRPVILITAHGTVDAAVEAMKKGALDFLTKPLDYPKLRSTLDAAYQEIARRKVVRDLERRLDRNSGLGMLIGTSKPMCEVYKLIELLAASDASAIVTGESGTGKEFTARTIHELSKRRQGPFVALNAAAIPEGLVESELFGHEKGSFTGAVAARAGCFELANGGTLFLDEISEMPMALQPKLLRILEDGRVRKVGGRVETQVDVRVLAATNRDPERAVEDGNLREDLFYRLNVFTIDLPPLRKRAEDVPLLVQHFVRKFNEKHGAEIEAVDPETLELLKSYGWRGNVRELRNVIERAVILANRGWVQTVHLPPFIRDPSLNDRIGIVVPAGSTVAEAERLLILETLKRVGNNKAEAARRLGLDVKTIRNKLRTYGEKAPT